MHTSVHGRTTAPISRVPFRRAVLAALLGASAVAATAQSDLGCDQLATELQLAAARQVQAASPQAEVAAAAGAQVLGALVQQAGSRSGGLGSMLGGLIGGGAAPRQAAGPAQAVQAAQAVQLLQVAQVVQAAQAAQAGQAVVGGQPAASAQLQAAAVQAAALQAVAQQRGVGAVAHAQVAQAAGVMGLLGGLMSAAQAQQNAPTTLAGLATTEQLGALFAAKGCKLPA